MPNVGNQLHNDPRPAFFDDPARACAGADPRLFFPETRNNHGHAAAIAVCRRCPFVDDCREWAVARPLEVGVWGGTTFKERVRIRKERREAADEVRVPPPGLVRPGQHGSAVLPVPRAVVQDPRPARPGDRTPRRRPRRVCRSTPRPGRSARTACCTSRARVDFPGVRVAFHSVHGPLTYATDRFDDWRDNVRAIALGLEALRAVDRYGVSGRGEQYRGWTAIESAPAELTVEQAAEVLAEHSGRRWTAAQILTDRDALAAAYKAAARQHHPDIGGDPDKFDRITKARDLVAGGGR
jgi:hypothetical protein